MYRIINTSKDRAKHLLHRTASKFEDEPSLGGVRIRLGSHYDISDTHYTRVKPTVDQWVKNGMVDVFHISEEFIKKNEGLDSQGPTFEEWTAAGYSADKYPPTGYAEVFSPGLVAYKRAQEEKMQAFAKSVKDPTPEELEVEKTKLEETFTPEEVKQIMVPLPPTNQPPLPPTSAVPKPAKKKF